MILVDKNRERVDYSASSLELVEDCIAFHKGPFSKAWLEALFIVSQKPRVCTKILELGASGESVISPMFAKHGSKITVSCYETAELPALEACVKALCIRHEINSNLFTFKQIDCFAIADEKYDLIITNRMVGGLSRDHDFNVFKKSIDAIRANLTNTGWALIVDKAKPIFPFSQLIQKFGSAGRNHWHYFSNAELEKLYEKKTRVMPIKRYGFLSVGNFNGGFLEKTLDRIDDTIEEYFRNKFGPVYLAVLRK